MTAPTYEEIERPITLRKLRQRHRELRDSGAMEGRDLLTEPIRVLLTAEEWAAMQPDPLPNFLHARDYGDAAKAVKRPLEVGRVEVFAFDVELP